MASSGVSGERLQELKELVEEMHFTCEVFKLHDSDLRELYYEHEDMLNAVADELAFQSSILNHLIIEARGSIHEDTLNRYTMCVSICHDILNLILNRENMQESTFYGELIEKIMNLYSLTLALSQ